MQSIAKHYRFGNISFETVTVTNQLYKPVYYVITINTEDRTRSRHIYDTSVQVYFTTPFVPSLLL